MCTIIMSFSLGLHTLYAVQNEIIGEISSFTKSLTMLNREVHCIPLLFFLLHSLHQLKWTAEALIRNTQGEKLDALCCRPGHSSHNTLLSAVVVHTAITIYSRSTLDIMRPLFNMVEKPGDLQVHVYRHDIVY